jgi:hypothetical protein
MGICEGPCEVVDEEVYYNDDGDIDDTAWVHRCEKHAVSYRDAHTINILKAKS